ncbi:MAG TPA: hypothetical protein VLF62_04170 [Candidatus Saccharimonadales bacterium]|nr:hypothetical protein [Candidatus Saccharimonadales bacterium]
MPPQEAITAPQFRQLLNSSQFHEQLDNILLYSERTHGNAGFAVYQAAGELMLSESVTGHGLQELTIGDDGYARPDLAATVHTHQPDINNAMTSGLLSPQDLRAHVLYDRVRPGIVTISAKQYGQDFEEDKFIVLHMARAAADEPMELDSQMSVLNGLDEVYPRIIPAWEEAMQEAGLVSARARYTPAYFNKAEDTPKYRPGVANLTRQLFWGVR